MLQVPELHRELPGASGHLIDSPGALAVLNHIGYAGPVVAEPFNRSLMALPIDEAVAQVASALDATFAAAAAQRLPLGLIGTHPYLAEPLDATATAAARAPRLSQGAEARAVADRAAEAAHQSLKSAPPLRWGILATGKASSDFSQALKLVSGASVVAVGARRPCDAEAFARKQGIVCVIGSYEDVCRSECDIVYIGSLHPWHRQHAEMALRHGKHVLVEKPIAMTLTDAAAIYDAGRKANRLVLEGMWTRFFPSIVRAKALLRGGAIGELVSVRGDFGIDGASDVGPYPADTIFQKALGGGAVTLLGPYLVQAALLGLDDDDDKDDDGDDGRSRHNHQHHLAAMEPHSLPCVVGSGIVDRPVASGGGGAELAASAVLTFPPPTFPPPADDDEAREEEAAASGRAVEAGGSKRFKGLSCGDGHNSTAGGGGGWGGGGGAMASLSCSLLAESPEEVCFIGTRGTLTVRPPAHCPTEVIVRIKSDGRGTSDGEPEVYVDPLPAEPAAIRDAGGFIMPNSIGFAYEAAAVATCVSVHANTCRQWPARESLKAMAIIERWRDQVFRAV